MSEIVGEGEARRFYESAKAVPLDGSWCIELDGRVVKTPMGATFLAPTSALADVVVGEWDAQVDKVIPATMPLASLCNAAIDRIAPDPSIFVDQLIGYARSDLLCYWVDQPDDLIARQHDQWQPILDWAADSLQARFEVTSGILPIEQPEGALEAIAGIVRGLDSYQLTGIVDLASRLNSVLLSLALWKGKLDEESAFQAAFLDELFQEEQWGEDREAVQRRTKIREETSSTVKFLCLLVAS